MLYRELSDGVLSLDGHLIPNHYFGDVTSHCFGVQCDAPSQVLAGSELLWNRSRSMAKRITAAVFMTLVGLGFCITKP